MDLKAYTTCYIQFIPTNKQEPDRRYSERTLIELRQNDAHDYFLRAIDIENNRAEIFNVQLKKREMYKFGASINLPDEIRGDDGLYLLYLNLDARNKFHDGLNACFKQLQTKNQEQTTVDSGKSSGNKFSTGSSDPKTIDEGNDILIDIHKLSEYIQEGKETKAANLVLEFIRKGVQLQIEESDRVLNEKTMPIIVQIDCIDSKIKDKGKEYTLNVYPSTKIHELRTIFQYVYGFSPANQYFFVNGHLAYSESTMKDLNIQKNSLFVLFSTDDDLIQTSYC